MCEYVSVCVCACVCVCVCVFIYVSHDIYMESHVHVLYEVQ